MIGAGFLTGPGIFYNDTRPLTPKMPWKANLPKEGGSTV